MTHLMKFATSSAIIVLGTLGIATTPAWAEKTAEQIKCEEEGGTWSDKGNGNTFCFKKLPPMQRVGPTNSGSPSPNSVAINAASPNSNVATSADCDDACKAHADLDCDGVADRSVLPAGNVKTSAAQNGQILRHAETGASCQAGRRK